MKEPEKTLVYWMGKPINELSKDELVEAFRNLSLMYEKQRQEADKWRNAKGDPLVYLME